VWGKDVAQLWAEILQQDDGGGAMELMYLSGNGGNSEIDLERVWRPQHTYARAAIPSPGRFYSYPCVAVH
jgi:hypothetical protein